MEGPGQLLIGVGDLGFNRGRAICTAPFKGSRGIGLSVVGYLSMPPRNPGG
jgi:hypothetical protein